VNALDFTHASRKSLPERHTHRYFRGLLKLHARYGLPGCSPTICGLYRVRSALAGFPARALATKFNRQPP
jgi:hypothetical protein